MATGNTAQAQIDAIFSQYFAAMGYYNAGYAGVAGDLNVLAVHKQQWVGIKGAPKPFLVAADMPLSLNKTQIGVGAMIFTESIGLFRNSLMGLQAAYKQKLFGGVLSIGVQPAFFSSSFDYKGIFIPESEAHDKEDEALPVSEDVSGMGFDLNAGIYYTHKKFYAGLGVLHAMEPEIEMGDNITTYIPRSYNLTGGYNIQLRNPLYELQPSVFLLTDMQSFVTDITAKLEYNKMFNGGFSWRVNNSIVVMLGATIGNFQVGYAYDLPINKLIRGSSGSHELMVKYRLKLNKTQSGNYKHKSVRIL
jgi:type IX secretion system PorP/SprF family membrane protein